MNTQRHVGAVRRRADSTGLSHSGRLAVLGILTLVLVTLAAAGTPAAAALRSGSLLTVRFTNNSDRDLILGPYSYNGCPATLPDRINAGATASWTLNACNDPTGNVGTVAFNIARESGRVNIGWNAPLVGSASYTESAPSSYVISHSGGQGLDPTVDFTFDCSSRTCDGIPDSWKTNGVYINPADGSAHTQPGPGLKFIDLPAMGATVNKPDIFVQVDWMADTTHSHALSADAIKRVVNAFANSPYRRHSPSTGINLHVDAGPDSILDFATDKTWGTLSTARKLPETKNLGTSVNGRYQWNAFNTIKTEDGGFTSTGRAPIFHYAISAHNLESGSTSSGIAPTPGSDLIVSLGSFANQVGTVSEQAGTFMHELGHNLNLEHGGNNNVNHKPQYFSVMNYLYQMGLTSGSTTGTMDFSRQNTALDENSLDERSYPTSSGNHDLKHYCPNQGGGGSFVTVPAADKQVDWNCDGQITGLVGYDVNNDGARTTLTGWDDWSNLLLRAGSIGTSSSGTMPAPTMEDEMTPADEAMNEPLDTTPPVTRARTTPRPDSHGVYHSNVTVTLTATDDLSGVARTEYDLDGKGWKKYTSRIKVRGDGMHELLFRSIDHAQNHELAKSLGIRIRNDSHGHGDGGS
ncbi:OmpL47-type beta-barrel domain-containing protein [Streptomyces sp. NPDC101234]|uniref:OmpL47-type beta-barrel domain-containing protein n=1 Tax=Streptomyces sp. NPDC101234 TaxID=3366138 RepID=UPI0037FEB576